MSNGIFYDNQSKSIGYNPFWIPLNDTKPDTSKNISLAGTEQNPFIANMVHSNEQVNILDGYRDVVIYANANNYLTPGLRSDSYNVGGYWLYYSKYNGILTKLGLIAPEIWIMFHFAYIFTGSFSLAKTNIDFGSIDYGYTLITIMAPLWIPILICLVIILIILYKNQKKK